MDSQQEAQAKARVQEAFGNIDANGDGFLTKDEILNCLKQANAYQQGKSEAEVQELIDTLDSNSDGKISTEEFMSAFFG